MSHSYIKNIKATNLHTLGSCTNIKAILPNESNTSHITTVKIDIIHHEQANTIKEILSKPDERHLRWTD